MEWGIFNDEGLVEGQFADEAAARLAAAGYDADDAVYVAEVVEDEEEEDEEDEEDEEE